jgi:hypothetical protein
MIDLHTSYAAKKQESVAPLSGGKGSRFEQLGAVSTAALLQPFWLDFIEAAADLTEIIHAIVRHLVRAGTDDRTSLVLRSRRSRLFPRNCSVVALELVAISAGHSHLLCRMIALEGETGYLGSAAPRVKAFGSQRGASRREKFATWSGPPSTSAARRARQTVDT